LQTKQQGKKIELQSLDESLSQLSKLFYWKIFRCCPCCCGRRCWYSCFTFVCLFFYWLLDIAIYFSRLFFLYILRSSFVNGTLTFMHFWWLEYKKIEN